MTTNQKKIKFYKKKRFKIILIILVAFIGFRIYLPTLVKNNINDVLADIPGYYGHVEDIDIALIRGAYVINDLYLNKTNAKTQIPFLKFPKSDISIEWKSIFKGKIVSEVIMTKPEIIYVFEDQQAAGEETSVDDWTKALTNIIPININHFEVHQGKLAFVQVKANPDIDLHISGLEMYANNLRNIVAKEHTLPSEFHATGVSVGNGNMVLDGNINLVKEIPDMDLSLSLKSANVTALNDLTRHYAGIDFSSGIFELYSEIAIADGFLKGYVKPLLKNSKLIGKDDKFFEVLWEGLDGFFIFLLKNHKTNTLATKIPIEGNLNDIKTGVWSSVTNIFKNAWVKAFKGEVDNDVEYKDAFQEKRASKKELRAKKRAERKAEKAKAK
ncbi:AsmA family protein [Siansivirga zeaxanthinifaciens]|uniref:DUF748 domain-containing protein n=1 Tax=Siansivirga zeaxanthinifaciens CC-SAMT-1 TaxID=1454006 RepID=A0A0C5W6X6_9FLAO|nr:DUF748 domain-containing protein [Siansivirga zeaxanthinifaciens]AJR02928.1 hypothetical protein AW14_04000 [Siansivirga zeaxanthinifaciens CC-SAMT-1]